MISTLSNIVVGTADINTVPMDLDRNAELIVSAIQEAYSRGCHFLCNPELCLTGYGCEDWFQSVDLLNETTIALNALVTSVQEALSSKREADMIYTVGLPMLINNGIYNVVAVCSVKNGIVGIVPKKTLAKDGVHYEGRFFKAWPEKAITSMAGSDEKSKTIEGGIPVGDISFCFGEDKIRLGLETCEEAWTSYRPVVLMMDRNLDIVFNCSASHFAFGKYFTRCEFVTEASRSQNLVYAYANLLGNESGRVVYDGGGIIASGGKIISAGQRMSFKQFIVNTTVIDLDILRTKRAAYYSRTPVTGASEEGVVHVNNMNFKSNAASHITRQRQQVIWSKQEETSHALALGLFDYIRKSHSKGAVISLSGGADSSMVAIAMHDMIELASIELGFSNAAKAFGLNPESTLEEMKKQLITCVYQPAKNSGKITLAAARAVAGEIGAKFMIVKVADIVNQYTGKIAKAMNIKNLADNFKDYDIPNQNIQARVRAPSVWMIANITGALLLTTSNRSEVAVGYATMDGDTCGGLAPIGGLDKKWVREFLQLREKTGPSNSQDLTALPGIVSLKLVNVQAPTAELKPQKDHQTDEKDLMPYNVLNDIERCAIIDKMGPERILLRISELHSVGTYVAAGYIIKFFRLWCRNQWKRERYAPSFHLDDESLDPRTFCRFPILNSGMRRELANIEKKYITDQSGLNNPEYPA